MMGMLWGAAFSFISRSIVSPIDRICISFLLPFSFGRVRLDRNFKRDEELSAAGRLVIYNANLSGRDGAEVSTRDYQVNRDIACLLDGASPAAFVIVKNGALLDREGQQRNLKFRSNLCYTEDLPRFGVSASIFVVLFAACGYYICVNWCDIDLLKLALGAVGALVGSLLIKEFEVSSLEALRAQREVAEMQTLGQLSERFFNVRRMHDADEISGEEYNTQFQEIVRQLKCIQATDASLENSKVANRFLEEFSDQL